MIVVDTGVLLGAANSDDKDHQRCAQTLRDNRGGLRAPAPVVPETAWQIERKLGPAAEAKFIRLVVSGELVVVDLELDDYQRCAELIEKYADMGLGFVDASVIVVAEKLDIVRIATLNRRDFSVVRSRHREAFELFP